MYLIGNFKLWKKWDDTGIELLVSPLDAEVRADIMAALPAIDENDNKAVVARFDLYVEQAAQQCVHDWKNVGQVIGGKPAAVPFSADNLATFLKEPRARDFVQALIVGLGVRKADEIEAAGNG